jgi:hypothetical protein
MKMKCLKLFMLIVALPVAALAQFDTNSQHFYLFTYFLNSNDQAGPRLAVSSDAITWKIIKDGDPIFTPTISTEHRARDPYTLFNPRTGVFHMVWTTGWTQQTIGYAESKDLKKWSIQYGRPVSATIPNAACTWAPEIFYDDIKDSFMVYWSTERGTNGKRSYYCMTKDFKNFTNAQLFFDPGYSVIDNDIIKVADGSYYMFFKDERDPAAAGKVAKNLHFVYGPTPQGPWNIGPWDKASRPITNPGCEGPSSIKIGSEYWVIFDPYISFTSTYRVVKVADLSTTTFPWPEGDALKTTTGTNFLFSHGHIIEIPRAKVMDLVYGVPDTTVYPDPYPIKYEPDLGDYPEGKRNCGCGTGVGLALLPPIFFKVASYRRKKKQTDRK